MTAKTKIDVHLVINYLVYYLMNLDLLFGFEDHVRSFSKEDIFSIFPISAFLVKQKYLCSLFYYYLFAITFKNLFSAGTTVSTYRSLQVYQRSYSQVGHRVLSDFTLKIVRPNCPTKSSQVGVRVSTLR